VPKVGSGRPNAVETSTTLRHSERQFLQRPWLG
jgi:hypothetical protein